jgi:hypothetical protein
MADKRDYELDSVGTITTTHIIRLDKSTLTETTQATVQEFKQFLQSSGYDIAAGATYTWPLAADYTGLTFTLKCTYDGVCAVSMQGSETMDSGSSFDLIEFESITALSDGTNWVII